jgi:hypothetical protein
VVGALLREAQQQEQGQQAQLAALSVKGSWTSRVLPEISSLSESTSS